MMFLDVVKRGLMSDYTLGRTDMSDILLCILSNTQLLHILVYSFPDVDFCQMSYFEKFHNLLSVSVYKGESLGTN